MEILSFEPVYFFCFCGKMFLQKIVSKICVCLVDSRFSENMDNSHPREPSVKMSQDVGSTTTPGSGRTVSKELNEIPHFLRNSDFYRSLDEEDGGVIEIPCDCFQATDEASSVAQFSTLLHSMRFWGVDEFPQGVVLFCVENDPLIWSDLVCEILQESASFSYKHLEYVFEQGPGESLLRAIKIDRTDIVRVLAARLSDQRASSRAMTAAAKLGRIQCLVILNQLQYTWDANTCAEAAAAGHLDCLQYAFENFCPWNEDVYKCAALHGHIDCMVYAHDYGLEWHEDVCASAAQNNQLECLRYARELGCPWTAETLFVAARHGSLNCLKYSLEEGCPVGENLCAQACLGGQLSALQYLHDQHVPWDTATTAAAASANDVSCLHFAHARGCQWDQCTTQKAAVHGSINTLKYAMENGCPYARDIAVLASCAEKNSLQCLRYLIEEQGLFMGSDGSLFGAALMRADFECVQYLLDVGCPFLIFTIDSAAVVGSDKFKHPSYDRDMVRCLTYASDRGWKCDPKFAQFVSEQPTMPLCKEYLHREWGIRQMAQ